MKKKLKTKTTGGDISALATNISADPDPKAVNKFLETVSYINLVKNGDNDNFSSYKLPTRKPWGQTDTSVKTIWKKLRFDPSTMLVNTGDFTFSSSTGHVSHSSINPDKIPYASAFGCESDFNADGQARIDLTGTNFAIDDVFSFAGWNPKGTVALSNNNQIADIRGGGYCGWIAPQKAQGEVMAHTGGWHLKLKVIAGEFTVLNGNTYLNLVKTGANDNFSMYKNPTRKPWGADNTDIKTIFTKVRFDPSTMMVNTGDMAFATSTGKVNHNTSYPTTVPYATAFGCEAPFKADGTARIDLTGTNYAVDDTWTFGGWQAAGSATVTSNGQIVDIVGGGYCGMIGPARSTTQGENHMHAGGFDLKLKKIA